MFFFVIVVTHDLTYVLFILFVVIDLRPINSNDRSGIFLVPSLVLSALFLSFLSFLGALSIISALNCHFLGRSRHLSLGVVPAMIFYYFLSLDFVCSGVHQWMSSRDLLIGFLYVRTWL